MAEGYEEPSDEITPPTTYWNRRTLLQGGILAASAAATAGVYRLLNSVSHDVAATRSITDLATPADSAFRAIGETPTPLEQIANYNNFYEFSTDKYGVAAAAAKFDTKDWKVDVGGLVHSPRTFDLDDLRKIAKAEERIYRMRCVEAWSMVIPWAGWSLSKLLDVVKPTSAAKYVVFQTLLDRTRMPGQRTDVLDWPYVEGLRLDEAMHPLAILAMGIYGRELPPQDGAPIRLVVPWKYGFKGIKSIVRITLAATQPRTTWSSRAPAEYGFYANVNPDVPHPRWSQADEQRIGEQGRRKTLLFNGYAAEVAALYSGMDLHANY